MRKSGLSQNLMLINNDYSTCQQGYIFWPFEKLSKLKDREEFEGGLHEKGRKKGRKEEKRKKVIKHTLKYLYEVK